MMKIDTTNSTYRSNGIKRDKPKEEDDPDTKKSKVNMKEEKKTTMASTTIETRSIRTSPKNNKNATTKDKQHHSSPSTDEFMNDTIISSGSCEDRNLQKPNTCSKSSLLNESNDRNLVSATNKLNKLNCSNSVFDLDDDLDNDTNVKKFKLNITKANSFDKQSNELKTNEKAPVLIKNKIFKIKHQKEANNKEPNVSNSCTSQSLVRKVETTNGITRVSEITNTTVISVQHKNEISNTSENTTTVKIEKNTTATVRTNGVKRDLEKNQQEDAVSDPKKSKILVKEENVVEKSSCVLTTTTIETRSIKKTPSKSKNLTAKTTAKNKHSPTDDFINETIISSGSCDNLDLKKHKKCSTSPINKINDNTLVPNTNKLKKLNGSNSDLDLDDDLDDDLNVKKFKLNIRKEASEKNSNALKPNEKAPVLIKNKIFNSKHQQEANVKVHSYKINFNVDNDQESDASNEDEIIRPNNSPQSGEHNGLKKTLSLKLDKNELKMAHSNLTKTQSLRIQAKSKDDDYLEARNLQVNLRNSRKAYECEELGEAQAFLDDLNYLVEGLGADYKLSERCLSSLKLAEQCLSSEFRINLRSSLSNDGYYLNKLFNLLSDSTKYKSLSLCTCLIVYELTQDKLLVEIDKSLFDLILSIINLNEPNDPDVDVTDPNKFNYLNDILILNQNKNSTPASGSSPLSGSPISSSKEGHLNTDFDSEDNDEYVYKKIFSKCKKLFEKLSGFSISSHSEPTYDLNFSSQLLSLDCLLNLNKNTKNLLYQNESFKAQLRELKILDKLLVRIKWIQTFLISNATSDNGVASYLLERYISCLNLFQTVTQTTNQSNEMSSKSNKKVLSICHPSTTPATTEFFLNQNYLIEFKKDFLIVLIKKFLNYCYDQLNIPQKKSPRSNRNVAVTTVALEESQNQNDQSKTNVFSLMTNLIKEIFALLTNITHNNEANCEKLSSEQELLDASFRYFLISRENSICHIAEDQQFDIQIMLLGFILNLFVNSLKKKSSLNLINYKNKKLNSNLFDIVLDLYLTKEALVRVAENDQENEFNQLNEQIESQNVENINLAIMNSIHKAGKHMEDHIVAAHTALVIGYMLINDNYNNSERSRFDIKCIRGKLKDNSFKFMIQIIRKFIVFMNIMKVSGFSADEHIEIILNYLEKLDSN